MEEETIVPEAPIVKKRGGRPRKKLAIDPAEFQAAVAAAVAQIIGKMQKEPASEDQDFVRRLAMNIAELSDQGTNRKRVAPEILEAREQAKERMVALIVDARRGGRVAEYAVMNKIYLNEQVVEPFHTGPDKVPRRTVIEWNGVPNGLMVPLNDVAQAISNEFKAWTGGGTIKTPKDDMRGLWVTPGGLVVKGNAAGQRREVGNLGDPMPVIKQEPDYFPDSLSVRTAHDPTAKEVHVLGTIHPPAQQNYQGSAPMPQRARV